MCGIAGLAFTPSVPPPDTAVLAAMTHALRHRGPDGSGSVMIGQAALAHTRLAIIDLPGGDQPFFAGPAALIANGGDLQFRELRAEMTGVAFASNSDCEPPLHLFRANGQKFAEKCAACMRLLFMTARPAH